MKYIASLIFLATTVSEGALAQCTSTYADLQAITSNYVASRLKGDISLLSSVATYTENFVVAPSAPSALSKSIFAAPLAIAHNRSLHDTTACATYTELVVTDTKHPYVIGTQLRVGEGNVVKEVDTLITDAGDWAFNATGTLYWASREDWSTIPLAKRDTRNTILSAGNAYLDLWKDKSVKVPWGTPCARLEGGAYTGRGLPTDSCDVGVPTRIVEMVNRRWVIDETVGAVDIFVGIGNCGTSRPDSHEFRLEGGKIRFIHTLTVMDPKCPGLPSQACECRI